MLVRHPKSKKKAEKVVRKSLLGFDKIGTELCTDRNKIRSKNYLVNF